VAGATGAVELQSITPAAGRRTASPPDAPGGLANPFASSDQSPFSL
jgi:hypothetical protein